MKDKNLREKFIGKKLGASAYKNGTTYSIDELADIDKAYPIMYEVWSHEGYLTNYGLQFLKEVHGLESLAEQFVNKGGFDELKDHLSILKWLNSLDSETIN